MMILCIFQSRNAEGTQIWNDGQHLRITVYVPLWLEIAFQIIAREALEGASWALATIAEIKSHAHHVLLTMIISIYLYTAYLRNAQYKDSSTPASNPRSATQRPQLLVKYTHAFRTDAAGTGLPTGMIRHVQDHNLKSAMTVVSACAYRSCRNRAAHRSDEVRLKTFRDRALGGRRRRQPKG